MTQFGIQYFEARGAETAAAVRAQGCEVARVQLFTDHDDNKLVSQAKAEEIIGEVLDAGMEAHVLVRLPEQVAHVPADPRVQIDFYNEGDLEQYHMPIELFLERLFPMVRACDGRNPLAVGGVANWDDRGKRYMARIPWRDLPDWVDSEHHWYPGADERPHESHIERGFFHKTRNTRHQDVDEIKTMVGPDRGLICSESGQWRRKAWTNPLPPHETIPERTAEEVAAWYLGERAHYIEHNYKKAISYQIDSEAPPPEGVRWEPQHGYGFREFGSIDLWLPAAAAWFRGEGA